MDTVLYNHIQHDIWYHRPEPDTTEQVAKNQPDYISATGSATIPCRTIQHEKRCCAKQQLPFHVLSTKVLPFSLVTPPEKCYINYIQHYNNAAVRELTD